MALANAQQIKDQSSKLSKLPAKVNLDIQIACGLIGVTLFSPQGIQQMKQMLGTAKDIVEVTAHLIFMAMFSIRQKLQQKGMNLDPRIWTCQGGVLDRVLFDTVGIMVAILKMPQAGDPKFVSAVKESIFNLMHDNDAASQGKQPPQMEEDDDEDQKEQQEDSQVQQQAGVVPPQQPQQQGLVAPRGQGA